VPVYEFYCSDCHRIFRFLSRSVNTEKRPDCPKCGRHEIERQVSVFAISKGRKEADEDLPPDMDEAKLESAMESLAADAEGLDENDPKQAAHMMNRLFEATGLPMKDEMREAIRRLEAGEDPDKLEQEMGDLFGDMDDPFSKEGVKRLGRRLLPPSHDETLYEL